MVLDDAEPDDLREIPQVKSPAEAPVIKKDVETLSEKTDMSKKRAAKFQVPQLHEDHQDQEGEIRLGVVLDPVDGLVHVNFGTLVSWVAMSPAGAVEFAKLLLKHAGCGDALLQ